MILDQNRGIDELEEVAVPTGSPDDTLLDAKDHTSYRSQLGKINFFQNKTQYWTCYRFSRLASAAQAPKVVDLKALNKLIREMRNNPVPLVIWKLNGPLRIMVVPDSSYQNNPDGSSQRGLCVFLCMFPEWKQTGCRGSLIEYESHKITRTTLNVTVAELYALMKGYGTGQWIRGLWADISGEDVKLYMRTDAYNLVTTAKT